MALSDPIASSSSMLLTPVPLANVSVPSMSNPSLTLIDDESPDTSELTVSAVSKDIVIVLPVALVVMPAPPDICNTSESKSIAMAVESSAAISRSSAVICVSTYDLIAFADAKVSSLPDTLDRSVSRTPDFKSATSMFEIELPVASTSNVLFVKVSVVALPTSVSVAAGSVTVTSAVDAGPISVTPFVPLSVPSKNFI